MEVEVKYQVPDRDQLLDRLAGLGVTLTGPVLQEDQAYAPADWSYGHSKIGVSFARLRTEADAHLFTVKKPVTDEQACIEYECVVSDRDAMHHALLTMGWRPTVRIVKERRVGRWGPYSVCVDDVEGLGTFVELEAIAEETTEARTGLRAAADRIGSLGEPVERTYDSLVLDAVAP